MTIKKLLSKNPDGISFKKKGLNYIPVYFKTGYFVALTDNCLKSKNYQAIISELHQLAEKLNLKHYYFGYWKDQKTQKEFLDLSLHLKNKREAVDLGRLFNQKAIFDCQKLDSIYL